jgi:hypothetical protein
VTPVTTLFRAELLALGARRRGALASYVLLLTTLLLMMVVTIRMQMREPEFAALVADAFQFDGPRVLMIPVLLGVLWALWAWRGEAPSQRGSFFSAPVHRFPHTLVRVGAGWLWLLACLAFYGSAAALALLAVAGPRALTEPALWWWGAVVLSATVAYLLAMPLALLTERPAQWLSGALLLVFFGPALLHLAGATRLREVFAGLSEHLGTALLAGPATAGLYLAHAATWIAIGAAATLLAALRYQEAR